tara:strand:- start:1225 stop:1599 length:375 start_codon:yes stop_codon:yes gene_type:complete
MNVYKIHVQHFSQKDSHESVETFLLAASDEDVYKWVDEKEYGTYTDTNNEDGKLEIYDDDFNVVGFESFKEKMIRVGGQYFNEDYEPSDLYYGATIYGWEKIDIQDVPSCAASLRAVSMLIEVK